MERFRATLSSLARHYDQLTSGREWALPDFQIVNEFSWYPAANQDTGILGRYIPRMSAGIRLHHAGYTAVSKHRQVYRYITLHDRFEPSSGCPARFVHAPAELLLEGI